MQKDTQSGTTSRWRLSPRALLMALALVAWWVACACAPIHHVLVICELVERVTNDRATDDTVRYVMNALVCMVCLAGTICIVVASIAIARKRLPSGGVVDGGAAP